MGSIREKNRHFALLRRTQKHVGQHEDTFFLSEGDWAQEREQTGAEEEEE
jgi:hypothetical protein